MKHKVVRLKHVVYGFGEGVKFRVRYFTQSRRIERTVFSGTKDSLSDKWADCVCVACDSAPVGSYYDKIITIKKPYKKPYKVTHKHWPTEYRGNRKAKQLWY